VSAPLKRVLVTGVSGFLGRYVALSLRHQHAVLGLYHSHGIALDACQVARLDVTDVEAVRVACSAFRPDVVVHTAAWGDVDLCERHPDEAHRVNVQGTESIAQGAAEVGAKLIYISTDQVYDGGRGHYTEVEAPHPLMVYGWTKLQGEHRAAAICRDTVILRLALMYGWGTPTRLNFVDWLIQRLRVGQEVPLFVDQYRTPLYVGQASEVIGRLISGPEIRGTFNLGGAERINRYGFGLKLCEAFDLPRALLKPTAMDSAAGLAARPRDCSMNSSKLASLLQIVPLTVAEGLRVLRQQRGG
jgi:dTDP-4-dehydrorhamnose reductase